MASFRYTSLCRAGTDCGFAATRLEHECNRLFYIVLIPARRYTDAEIRPPR